jgi:NAD(P)H-dependent FMN reductase
MNIGVIIGSTRPGRVGERITEWMLSSITAKHALHFEVIDLAVWDLPLFNEPGIPAKGEYTSEKTKQWSKKIGSKDGFIFVTPQYNWGYPASLKNAIDYLFNEWTGKPAVIASYANRGGGKAAVQLRQVLEGLRMIPVETMPAIHLVKDMYEDGVIRREFGEFGHLYSDTMNKAIEELQQEFNKKQS